MPADSRVFQRDRNAGAVRNHPGRIVRGRAAGRHDRAEDEAAGRARLPATALHLRPHRNTVANAVGIQLDSYRMRVQVAEPDLMYCARCGSPYHGDANNGQRRVRHVCRPSCSPSATYRADCYEHQLVERLNTVHFSDTDIVQIQSAMRSAAPAEVRSDPAAIEAARAELQRKLSAGEIGIAAFTREWRALERPPQLPAGSPVPDRLGKARRMLEGFGALWADPDVPDRLREEAVADMFTRFDVDGSNLVAIHPAPNENAWLLGQAAMRDESLATQEDVGLVGARGVGPRLTGSSGIWIPRLYRGRVLVTMGGARPPLRSVRSA